jgi:hypothetical protein
MKPKVLVVEDDDNVRSQMKWVLTDDYERVFSILDNSCNLHATISTYGAVAHASLE